MRDFVAQHLGALLGGAALAAVLFTVVVVAHRLRARRSEVIPVRHLSDATNRALWALARVEDKTTAALDWITLGAHSLAELKLDRSVRNLRELVGLATASGQATASLDRLCDHLGALSGTITPDTPRRHVEATAALAEIRTLRALLAAQARAARIDPPALPQAATS